MNGTLAFFILLSTHSVYSFSITSPHYRLYTPIFQSFSCRSFRTVVPELFSKYPLERKQLLAFAASILCWRNADARVKVLSDGDFLDSELTGFQITESGLKLKDMVVGSGAEPRDGQTATLHYSGYLLDGGVPFESSYERMQTFAFRVGGGDVIRGWDEAVRTMRIGGRRMAIIPPALGYGSGGAGGGRIPGGAELVFYLELLSLGP